MTLMERRRALMVQKKTSRLPVEYQEVEWIGYNGQGALINTYVPGADVATIKLKMARLDTLSTDTVFPCAFSGNTFASSIYNFLESQNRFSIIPTIQRTDIFGLTDFVMYRTAPFNANIGIGYKNGWCPIMRYGKIEMLDSGNNVISELVPCYRKSDSVIGMYDTIQNAFRVGTVGSWLAGNDVN